MQFFLCSSSVVVELTNSIVQGPDSYRVPTWFKYKIKEKVGKSLKCKRLFLLGVVGKHRSSFTQLLRNDEVRIPWTPCIHLDSRNTGVFHPYDHNS